MVFFGCTETERKSGSKAQETGEVASNVEQSEKGGRKKGKVSQIS